MNKHLSHIIENIREEFSDHISEQSRNYLEVDIGKRAKSIGIDDMAQKYTNVIAVVPIKEPVPGMKVMIDGRGFSGYAQFESGIVVPGFLARDSGLRYKTYTANESMILNVH